MLYISHRLDEVKRLCHHATILRHGKVSANVDPAEETAASLARLMVGADVHEVSTDVRESEGAVMLSVSDLTLPAEGPFGVTPAPRIAQVRAGEVVAIAGVAGNGQTELFDALSGERLAPDAESIELANASCGAQGITARRRLGAAFVPEERLGHSALSSLVLSDNVLLTRHAADTGMVHAGFVDRPLTRVVGERVVQSFDVRTSHPNPQASALSGGNLQKFVLGRELDRNPRIVVINQPTWGVDAGAAALIRQSLIDMARAGAAVLVISQDLDEIFEIADRIAVISRGELSAAYPANAIDREHVGLLMAGAHETRAAVRSSTWRERAPMQRERRVKLWLELRPEQSRAMSVVSPLIAIALTVIAGAIIFAASGLDPLRALFIYFVEPVTTLWSIEELVVKTAPLVLIGVGLAVCFRANLWNIGAEGQLTAGAIAGASVPILATEWDSFLVLPSMLLLGVLGGMAWAAVPALLRNRFGVNEILTSLMLVYVAQYLLDWLVRGPWRDPAGYNFPESIGFEGWAAPAHPRGGTRASRRAHRPHRGRGALRVHVAHAQGLRDPRERRSAPRRQLRRLLAPAHGMAVLRSSRARSPASPASARWRVRWVSSSLPSRPATDSPRSSWPSSDA